MDGIETDTKYTKFHGLQMHCSYKEGMHTYCCLKPLYRFILKKLLIPFIALIEIKQINVVTLFNLFYFKYQLLYIS